MTPNTLGRSSEVGRRASWGPLGLAWLGALILLYIWLTSVTGLNLREQLKSLHFWLLELNFLVLLALTVLVLPRLLRQLQLSRRVWGLVALIGVLSLFLVSQVAPRTNRIFYDEQIYLNIGQNLSDLHRAQMCNEGNVEYGRLICNRGEYNKQPYGYPYLLSLGYRIFGAGEGVAYSLNNASAVALSLTVFLTSLLLFGDTKAALLAALVSAMIPHLALWSNTAAAESTAALAVMVAVLTAVWFARDRSMPTLLWMVSATAFAAQFRPESLLCVPLVLAILAVLCPQELRAPRTWWAALAGLVLCAALLAHNVAVRAEGWGTTGPRMSWSFLSENLTVNGLFYLTNRHFPALYTGLAAVGLLWKARREVWVPVVHFGLFWGVFLFFYAGSYAYGADVRYSLLSYGPLAILTGRGARLLAVAARNRFPDLASSAVVAGLLLFNFLPFLPQIRTVGEEAWSARADVRFAREFAKELPSNSIILTHNPSMFLLWGRNAAQATIALGEPTYVEQHLPKRYAGGVFFHWNFWCNVDDPAQVSICERILDRYPAEPISLRRERDYRYILYRLPVSAVGQAFPGQAPGAVGEQPRPLGIKGGPAVAPTGDLATEPQVVPDL